MTGDDYEAAKPIPTRTTVTGDPWSPHGDNCACGDCERERDNQRAYGLRGESNE